MNNTSVVFISVIFLLIASCAFATDSEIKFMTRMETGYIGRDLSLGMEGFEKNDQIYEVRGSEGDGYIQALFSASAELTQQVSTEIGVLYETMWNNITDGDPVYLELGYVTFRDVVFDGITLQVGRQNLHFGRGFIIGDPDTNNQAIGNLTYYAPDISWRKSFNAARLTVDYHDLTTDVVYAGQSLSVKGDATRDDRLFGINSMYSFSDNALAEAYFWIFDREETLSSNTLTEDYYINIGGVRAENTFFDDLLVYAEAACQWGEGTAHIFNRNVTYTARCAGQTGIEYDFQNKSNAEVHAEGTYLPGTSNMNDFTLSSWNPVFEDQTPGEIGNLLFPHSNLFYLKAGGSSNLGDKLNLGIDFSYFRLAEKSFPIPLRGNSSMLFLDNGGGYYRYSVNPGKRDLGWEIDAFMKYDYSEVFQLRFTTAFFMPSDVFASNNDDPAYSVKLSGRISF
jgi:Alginate export